jgi:hypothetical protein
MHFTGLRKFTLGAAAAVALLVAPADAAFNSPTIAQFVADMNALEGLDAAQQKAVDKLNAYDAKTYTSFSKEISALALAVKGIRAAFSGNSEVIALTDTLCTESVVTGLHGEVLTGPDGTGAMTVALSATGPKGSVLAFKKIVKHLSKASESTDCFKRLKFWAKAQKGAEWAFKKVGS